MTTEADFDATTSESGSPFPASAAVAETPKNDPPMTRRRAREIERRTGSRPVATPRGSTPALAAPRSVAASPTAGASTAASLPSTVGARSFAVDGDGTHLGSGPFTIRADRPTALVRAHRARVVAGGAIGAAAVAMVAAGAAAPTTFGPGPAAAHEADLLEAARGIVPDHIAADVAPAEAFDDDDLVAAPAPDAPAATVVTTLDPETLAQTITSPTPEPAPAPAAGESRSFAAQAPASGQCAAPLDAMFMRDGYGVNRGTHIHRGVDLFSRNGTAGAPLYAVAAGTVTQAKYYGSYGNHVALELDDGTSVSYSHLSSFAVGVGDHVAAGEVIGFAGSTGRSTAAHLHFEVADGSVDPKPWLAACGVTF